MSPRTVSILSVFLLLGTPACSATSTEASQASVEDRGTSIVSTDVAYRASAASLDDLEIDLRNDNEIVVVFRSSSHVLVTYDHCSWGESVFEIDAGLLRTGDWEADAMECEPSNVEVPDLLAEIFNENPTIQITDAGVQLSTDRAIVELRETSEIVQNPYLGSTTTSQVEPGG